MPNMLWLPGAERDPIPGLGTAPFENEAKPAWKLLIHTTEGPSYAAARSSYVKNGFAPHVTAGPHPTKERTVKAWQHYPLNSRATTLADKPGGIRTNRDHVIQVEIVGFADLEQAARHGRWLGVDQWPEWYKAGVAKILRELMDACGIPRRCTVRWVRYPQSYGTNASQRLSTKAFDDYAGILGHQHAPENSHGDPGDISAFVRDYLLGEEDDDVAAKADDILKKLTELDTKLAAARRALGERHNLRRREYEALLFNVQQNEDHLKEVRKKLAELEAKVNALGCVKGGPDA